MSAALARLTSLLRVEERLLEANYFARLMRRQSGAEEFGYCLNAFVSAARSVSFLIQKEMSKVPGFDVWWSGQQQLLGQDRAARFFLKLRNYSQKEGRISLAGTRIGFGNRRRWTYRFAGTADSVPPELLQRDVTDCCMEHVSKLARVVLACTQQFPFHTCPRQAITPDGMEALQLSMVDLGSALGLPSGWVEAGQVIPLEPQLRLLREHVDGLDFDALKRLARRKARKPLATPGSHTALGGELLTHLVAQLEGARQKVDAPTLIGEMMLRGMVARGGFAPGSASDTEPNSS